MVLDSSGNVVGEQRYYPFGEMRLSSGNMFTDRLYTGQRELTGLGLYNYNARFYSPKLGRFIQADTIVPGAGNPQAFNRYSYVLNNPIKFNDPSGHMQVEYYKGGLYSISQMNKMFPPQTQVKTTTSKKPTVIPTAPKTSTPSSSTPTPAITPTEKTTSSSKNESVSSGDNLQIINGYPLLQTVTLHPFDNNIKSKVPIYDYSYFPPKLIGYTITAYLYDYGSINFDPRAYLPTLSDPATYFEVGNSALNYLLKQTTRLLNLFSFGDDIAFTAVCPECEAIVTVYSLLSDTNEAITLDGHLRTYDIYYVDYQFLEIPFNDLRYIKLPK